jgi:hypothetical protein
MRLGCDGLGAQVRVKYKDSPAYQRKLGRLKEERRCAREASQVWDHPLGHKRKRCSACSALLPRSEFWRCAYAGDGLQRGIALSVRACACACLHNFEIHDQFEQMLTAEPRELRYRNLVVPVTFLAAAGGTWTPGDVAREVRLICLHSAECGEVPSAAESLQTWAAGSAHPKAASWHFAVDDNSISQSVEIHNIAWHAGPINGYSIGIEQAGRAAQTREQWTDAYSTAMLTRTAQLIALIAAWYDLPIEHVVNPKDPKARGVCTHADVTRAWKTRGGHTDPGSAYPMDLVLAQARSVQIEAVS